LEQIVESMLQSQSLKVRVLTSVISLILFSFVQFYYDDV
jgi:hypothetical protein